MGGTDRKWQQSEAREAEVTPCEQPPYRFQSHFDTLTLYASGITRIPKIQIRSSSWIPECITREEIIIAYMSSSQIFFSYFPWIQRKQIFFFKKTFLFRRLAEHSFNKFWENVQKYLFVLKKI